MTGTVLVAWFNAQTWATETRRGYRSSLRVFYRWALAMGHVTASPASALPVVHPAPPMPRPVPDRDYRLALLAADTRTRLMVRLGAEVGLRRAEVAQVHSRDLIEDLDGWSLLVHGKGQRERLVPLPASIGAELRALPAGWAFPGDDHGHLSPRWVGTLVSRVLPEGHTMHALRHRFATRAYRIDHDVFAVQELLGHASPATTRRYVATDRDRLRALVEAVA